MVKFSKFCSESFHRDTNRRVALKFREIWVTGNSEIVRCLPNKKNKISPGSPGIAAAWIAPKICQGQPQQCTQSAPDFIQIGSLSAALQPNA